MNIKSTLICATMLAAGMLSATPAFAASNPGHFNVAVKSLVTYKAPPASAGFKPFGGPPPSTHFQSGDMVGIMCTYHFTGLETGEMLSKRRPWTIGIDVDGHKIASQNGTWPPIAKHPIKGSLYTTFSYTQSQFSAFHKWRATPGVHMMRCVLNENGAITETTKADDQRSIRIVVTTNASNLSKLKHFGPSKPMTLNSSNMSKSHSLTPMPNAHIRKCPTSVKAVSKIDPQAFYAPFTSTSRPTNIPEGHMTLYLGKVETFNDTLLCTYATRTGNAKTTVEIACKGAQKTTNGAYCQ